MGIAWMSGVVSGITESLVTTPFQVVKVRMQSKEYLGLYKNSIHCLSSIVRNEGPLAFMTGLGPSFWRNCTWNSVYFAMLFKIKSLLPETTSNTGDIFKAFFAGAISGGVACCFYAPFDVVKSRFQSQILVHGVERKYQYTIQTLTYILRNEGLRAIYKGLAPALLRMIVGGGVMVGTFEASCLFLLWRGEMSM